MAASARRCAALRERFVEAGPTAAIGPERFHSTVRAAVAACREDERLQPA